MELYPVHTITYCAVKPCANKLRLQDAQASAVPMTRKDIEGIYRVFEKGIVFEFKYRMGLLCLLRAKYN